MLLGKYVEADINFEELAKDISPKTQWGHNKLLKYFQGATDDVELLEKRRNVILKLRQHFRKTPQDKTQAVKLLERAAEIEKALEEKVEMEDERIKEYYAQILWEKDSFASFLNESPLWLETANLWKVWMLPAITMFIPLVIVVLPYVIIRMTTQAELTIPEYWELLQHILKQQGGQNNMIAGMLLPPWVSTGGNSGQIAQKWLQWGLSIFMFGSSIWQQITLSQHLHTITEDMRKRGALIWELQGIWTSLSSMTGPVITKYMDLPENEDLPSDDPNTLGVFGYTWNRPHVLTGLMTNVGILDVMITCATLPRIGFPTYVDGSETRLHLENFYHTHLTVGKMVTNTIDLAKTASLHALVTGPNRGGKSTSLKAILANVIVAQSMGFCWAKRMTISPFQQIHTALSPSDTLGRVSLFEAEIEFAKEILENLDPAFTKESGRSLLVMDEIFHSTNAIDGEEASRIFLDRLYALPQHASLISTHYTQLPETYTEKKIIQPLCLQASINPAEKDSLVYTYKIRKGINALSSVREILKERGLLSDKTCSE